MGVPAISTENTFLKMPGRVADEEIRRCANAVFQHYGSASDIYALVKLREARDEGNYEAIAVWTRIAGIVATLNGMDASTAIH